jgi:hypothetical protein
MSASQRLTHPWPVHTKSCLEGRQCTSHDVTLVRTTLYTKQMQPLHDDQSLSDPIRLIGSPRGAPRSQADCWQRCMPTNCTHRTPHMFDVRWLLKLTMTVTNQSHGMALQCAKKPPATPEEYGNTCAVDAVGCHRINRPGSHEPCRSYILKEQHALNAPKSLYQGLRCTKWHAHCTAVKLELYLLQHCRHNCRRTRTQRKAQHASPRCVRQSTPPACRK